MRFTVLVLRTVFFASPALPIVTIALISGLAFISPGMAQGIHLEEKEPWSFGVNGYYGALFRYKKGTPILNFTHPFAVELYAHRHTTGVRKWERQFRYPRTGFALSYYNYGVPGELGEAYTATAYLDNTLLKNRRSSLNLNLGTGLVYSTRHYTPGTNEGNKAIGSRFCFALRGNVRYELVLSRQWFMSVNLAFRHFSNGGLNKPNNGMNFPLLGLGVRYQPGNIARLAVQDSATQYDKKIHLALNVAYGRKEVLRIDKKHPVYSISVYAYRRLSPVNALLVGADAFYDSALRQEFINKALTPPEGELDPRMGGLTIGHALYLGKLALIFQLGHYFYKPYDEIFPDFYQRYGLKYRLTKHLSANVTLMAHSRTANVIEWGLGFHW